MITIVYASGIWKARKETIFQENTVFTLSETPCDEDLVLSFASITVTTQQIKRQAITDQNKFVTL